MAAELPKEPKLKRCPFCGGPKVQLLDAPKTKLGHDFWMYCKDCSSSGPVAGSEAIAAEKWNARWSG